MNNKSIILIIAIVILLVCDAIFVAKYFVVQQQLNKISLAVSSSDKIKFFNNIFIEKVLKSKGEVSYDDRVALENAAISTSNKEVVDQWHKLLESQTEKDAQKGVVDLLTLFAK